jgi:hypothetical protein
MAEPLMRDVTNDRSCGIPAVPYSSGKGRSWTKHAIDTPKIQRPFHPRSLPFSHLAWLVEPARQVLALTAPDWTPSITNPARRQTRSTTCFGLGPEA